VQTTLLGLAIAFIIALLAALIGPFFIDWSQFRPQFEAEASRIIGTPVRVGGKLDARLLPAPSLRLRDVTVGGANDGGKIAAEQLDVEFSLAALMRGDIRATELTANGASLDLGLDADGRIDWPDMSGGYDLRTLAIDRVNLTGRVALHDAKSSSTIVLDDIAFSGDVRALAGSIRGDGNFRLDGLRYPFRISSGPGVGNVGTRLRVTIDPAQVMLALDLDGLLTWDDRSPRFDGTLMVARTLPPRYVTDALPPWRVTAKLKADPANATLEQVEASYGPDEAAVKFAGTAAARLGATPQLSASLTTKTVDANRLLGDDTGLGSALPTLQSSLAALPSVPMPTRISLGIDQIIIGNKPVQSVLAELGSDGAAWRLERLDLRAPGATRVSMASVAAPTATAPSAASAGFGGTLMLDSSEPDVFAAWLQNRSESGSRAQKPLRIGGVLDVAADHVTLEKMTGEIDGSAIDGRIALAFPETSPSRADVRLRAQRLDIDAAVALARSLAGPDAQWPDEAAVSIDIGRATSAGQEMKPFGLDLHYDARTIGLDRLRVGEASGVMLDGSGSYDRVASTGTLTAAVASGSFAQLGSFIAPLAPEIAARIAAMPSASGPAKLSTTLGLKTSATDRERAAFDATLTITSTPLAGSVSLTATPSLAALRTLDVAGLRTEKLGVTTRLTSPQAANITALFGLGALAGSEPGAAEFEATLNGAPASPMAVAAKLTGPAIDVDLRGNVEPLAAPRKAALDLIVRRASLGPWIGMKAGDPRASVTALTAKLAMTGDRIALDSIDGVIASTKLRGKAAVTMGVTPMIDGDLNADAVALPALFSFAIGATGKATEPLSTPLQGWRGRLGFQATRARLSDDIELRNVSGTIKGDAQSLVVDGMKASLGGGDVTLDLDARPSLTGLAINTRLALANVDGAALRYKTLTLPGRASLKMTLVSQGRSTEALSGALSGDGVLTLAEAKLPALDPKAFDLALRASDDGRIKDDAALATIVQTALNGGPLVVPSAQFGLTIKDGNLRVAAATLEGEGARAIVSGGYDINADQVDLRALLIATNVGSGTSRPEIRVFAVGPPDRLTRAVDVTSFATWLAVRTIDRETQRLDQMERQSLPKPAVIPAMPSAPVAPVPEAMPQPRPRIVPRAATPEANSQLAPLPPAIDVRRAPVDAPASAPRPPRPRPPMVLTPSVQP
jgi:large subunit ribosomal protein L24